MSLLFLGSNVTYSHMRSKVTFQRLVAPSIILPRFCLRRMQQYYQPTVASQGHYYASSPPHWHTDIIFSTMRSKVTLKLEGGLGWCSLHGMISRKVKALTLLFMIHVTMATQSSRQQLELHRRIDLPNDVRLTSDLNITSYSVLNTRQPHTQALWGRPQSSLGTRLEYTCDRFWNMTRNGRIMKGW